MANASDFVTLMYTSETMMIFMTAAVAAFGGIFMAARYKRCPANRILVIYGQGTGETGAKCLHGGGAFVMPLVQDYHYMSLKPMSVTLDFKEILPAQSLTFDMPQVYHFAISKDPEIVQRAAERLLGMSAEDIAGLVNQILITQLRICASKLNVAQLNQNPEPFLNEFHSVCKTKLNELGLELLDT